uniref:Microfibril associated protein 5 n=1 Tax=Anas zonorhyncha TaxID=75864 RepID=A0A8B9U425_9AVES
MAVVEAEVFHLVACSGWEELRPSLEVWRTVPSENARMHVAAVMLDCTSVCVFSDCREEQFPCTRLYSVHKPVKQCISYLCVTSVRRMYIINKEVCSRIVCKENEVMQDEICRQLAGLPSRRLRRSGQFAHLPCRQLLEQQQRSPGAL